MNNSWLNIPASDYEGHMNLISDKDFKLMAEESGLEESGLNELGGKIITLEIGKRFYIGTYGNHILKRQNIDD